MWREEAHACDADSEVKMPTERMPTAPATGPYREHRRDFVMWIASKANRFSLKTLTIHYAANYLDRTMAAYPSTPVKSYPVIAAACLLIAGKFEERPDLVPLISELVKESTQHPLEASEISGAEICVLKALDWRLHCSTYYHFLDFHKCQGFVDDGDVVEGQTVSEKTRKQLIKYIYFFADMLLLDPDFCGIQKTISSAAIIATARFTVRMEPVWPAHLAMKTGFSVCDITALVDQMVLAFCRDWPDSAPQHLRNADNSPRSVPITTSCPTSSLPTEMAMTAADEADVIDEEYIDENQDSNKMVLDDTSWCSNATTEVGDSSSVGVLIFDGHHAVEIDSF